MANVTAQNKSEMGMNRNDFYEYKKNRIVEMIKSGADVDAIAGDLGLGDKDIYSFISRNFGGLKKLKSMIDSGLSVEQMDAVGDNTSGNQGKQNNKKSNKNTRNVPNMIISGFLKANKKSPANLENIRQQFMDEFKNSLDAEIRSSIPEIQGTLNEIKAGMLNKFKSELMNDLSAMIKSF